MQRTGNVERRPILAAGSISLATMISRVLGVIRLQVQSYYFGAGLVTDAFFAAFRIPNLLRDLFAEGALSAAFVPTFTAERERAGREAGWQLANRVFSMQLVIVGGTCLLILLAAPWIVRLYAPGFGPEKTALAVTMTRIMAPFLLLVAMAAVAMGLLNACGRFFLPALAPASFNVASILAVVALYPVLRSAGFEPGLALAIGVLLGGLLQFAVQIPAMRQQGLRLRLELAPRDPALRRIGRLMLPAVVGLAATQINLFVDTLLASFMGHGPLSWLNMAFRLMQLPIGLFGVAIGTANLAHVSRDVARGDLDNARANLASSLRAAALLTLPATAGLIALREPIMRVIFEHGAFTAVDTRQSAAALLCYSLGLFAYSVTKIQVPTYYALGNTRTPVQASVTAVAVKIAANFLLIWLLGRLGVEPFLALALSTSLAAWLNMGLLTAGLRRGLGRLDSHRVVLTTLQMAGLAAVMGVLCAALHTWLEHALPGGGLAGEIGRLGACIAVGLVVTAVGALALRVPEAHVLFERLRGRRGGDR